MVSSPLLTVYQKTVEAITSGADPSKDPGVLDAVAQAQAKGFSNDDINTYYQSGVTAPSRTTGGGGLLESVNNSIPLLEAAASAFIPGAAPVIAGVNAAQSLAKGNVNAGTLLNIATAAGGLPGSSNVISDVTGVSPSTVSQGISAAKTAAAAANAIKTNNVLGLISSIVQVTDSGTDVKSALNAANAFTAAQKGDIAGTLNALNNMTNSVDPKIAALAIQAVRTIDPSLLATKPVASPVTPTQPTTTDTTTDTTSTTDTTATPVTNPLATPTAPVSQTATETNPLDVPTMPKPKALPMAVGKMKEIDLEKLFEQVNSLNPVENNTIQARQGGSLDDLLRLLNRG